MDLSVLKDVRIGSICAVSILVFMRWWCRNHGVKPTERIVPAADTDGDDTIRDETLEPRHKVFLSHSGAQKGFVEQLCVDLEREDRYPFFDKRRNSLPIGKNFPKRIFKAIEQCEVGVVVLSTEFFTRSKWPMLELVAMTKTPKVVIIPVFLGISIKQVRDPKNQKRWSSIWRSWARKDKRGIDIQLWLDALKALGPLNALVYDGVSEVSFRGEIVEAVCVHIGPETRWDDSHVQGRFRLSQVIIDKIDHTVVSKKYGVRLVGLYGVGGIGKTTFCETLCNVYSIKMQGRVFHADLGRGSELELYQGALRSLTSKSHEMLVGLNLSQSQELLKREMQKQAVFLAIDNVSYNTESIALAKFLLSAGFDEKSVVIVTARSLDVLKIKHLDIDDSSCLEMPELEEEEAKSLFLQHAICRLEERNEVDDEIISRCIQRCYFEKLDGRRSYHYHPLALKVLGGELGFDKYDSDRWASQLKEFDTFNPRGEGKHPLFSILRKSFDTLGTSDQLLFLDVALSVPESNEYGWSVFEWLSMVHGISVSDVRKVLEGLKRKSLLEDLGDGLKTKIGMHDLWREFAETETKVGGFGSRRWVYEAGGPSSFEEDAPSGGWQNVKRMCFIGDGVISVKRINFDHFSNTTVMKLVESRYRVNGEVSKLEVKKLTHLKSMELDVRYQHKLEVYGFRLMEKLRYLKLRNIQVPNIDDIEHLTNLQVLVVDAFQGRRLPDLSKLVSLQVVHFSICYGMSFRSFPDLTKFPNLTHLHLANCNGLVNLISTGRLIALKELILDDCVDLNSMPDVSKFPGLKRFSVENCTGLMELKCGGPLDALEKLSVGGCSSLKVVPCLSNFQGLKKLGIRRCGSLVELTCNGPLVALEILAVEGCRSVTSMLDVSKFARLKKLSVTNCDGLMELKCGGPSDALEELYVGGCSSLKVVPSLSNFQGLKKLGIWGCDSLVELTCSRPLVALEELEVVGCRSVTSMPDVSKFAGLKKFSVKTCDGLTELKCGGPLDALEELCVRDCSSVMVVPSVGNFQGLKKLGIWGCDILVQSMLNAPLVALEELEVEGCRSVTSMPDVSKFAGLKKLSVTNCDGLMELKCGGPLDALEELCVRDCSSVMVVPSVGNFQGLKKLGIWGCDILVQSMLNAPLVALEELEVEGCRSVTSMPDVSKFAGLKKLSVTNCDGLMELKCGGPSDALEELYVGGCSSLKVVPSLSNFQGLKKLGIRRCGSLVELTCNGPLVALEELEVVCCWSVTSMPDVSKFAGLKKLSVKTCDGLTELKCGGPLDALEELCVRDCSSVMVVPSVGNFQGLKKLGIWGCDILVQSMLNAPLVALEELEVEGCRSVTSMPDVSKFAGLKKLSVTDCDGLTELKCGGPSDALEELWVLVCSSLKVVPSLSNFQGLKKLGIWGCDSLVELTCNGPLVALEELEVVGCPSVTSMPDVSKFAGLKKLSVKKCDGLMDVKCGGPLDAL